MTETIFGSKRVLIMRGSTTASVADQLSERWRENSEMPRLAFTSRFKELKQKFFDLRFEIGRMSSGFHEGVGYIDELHYQRKLDRLTDEMHGICIDLCDLRSTCVDHLRLKISALLYLLPDEEDTEPRLAKSLLLDLDEQQRLQVSPICTLRAQTS
jgi:hypothetical protein